MPLPDVTAADVVGALDEFDALGRQEFLSKYGFGESRRYFLVYCGKDYDSKAVVGAAHTRRHGVRLTAADFSGGEATVQNLLEGLGFTVEVRPTPAAANGGTTAETLGDLAMSPPQKPPGTYRVADESRMSFSEAMAAWIPLAYDELLATARRYHAVVTYLELGEHVQDRSGIRTRVLLTNWIGKLLEEVALRAKHEGLPPLTSLCVRQDGTIGPGYARAPKATEGEPGEDIESYAAEHRLLCYRRNALDIPEDGGLAALTRAEQQRRQQKAKTTSVVIPRCASCNTELPRSGRCDYCD